jgi:hypothetical protein
VSDRNIRRYRPYHQLVKKSLTSAQKQLKLLFSQQYMNINVKKCLFCDEKVFTMQSTGTIAWTKAFTPRPTHYVDDIKAHVQL